MKTYVIKKLIIITFMLLSMLPVFGQKYESFVPPTGNSYVIDVKNVWNSNEESSWFFPYSVGKVDERMPALFEYKWFDSLTVTKVDTLFGFVYFKAIWTDSDGNKNTILFSHRPNTKIFYIQDAY